MGFCSDSDCQIKLVGKKSKRLLICRDLTLQLAILFRILIYYHNNVIVLRIVHSDTNDANRACDCQYWVLFLRQYLLKSRKTVNQYIKQQNKVVHTIYNKNTIQAKVEISKMKN